MAVEIEVVRDTAILSERQRVAADKEASRNLGIMIRCHNQKLLLQANHYAYNPHLSYREKIALAEKVMFSAWRGLSQAGFPHVANGVAKIGRKDTP